MKSLPCFKFLIGENNQINLEENTDFNKYVKKFKAGDFVSVSIEPYKSKRSNAQNRYLWGYVYDTIIKHYDGYTQADKVQLHKDHKQMFAPKEIRESRLTGEEYMDIVGSSEMNKEQMTEFIENIKKYHAQFDGVVFLDISETNY